MFLSKWSPSSSWVLLAVLLVSCGHSAPGESAAAGTPAPRGTQAKLKGENTPPLPVQLAAKSPAAKPPVGGPGQVAAAGPVTVHFDLAGHPQRAEQRLGETLLVDFGVPGDAKYTLGGWLTGSGPAKQVDKTSARVVTGKTVKLALPADSSAAAQLALRLRGFRPGPVTVYVNGETVANEKLAGDEFQVLHVPLAADLLKRGENLLQLRVSRTGSAPGVPSAGLAIDWLQLGPKGADLSQTVPALATAGGLKLPAGHAVHYTMEVPAGAELRGKLSGGEITVSAALDTKPARQLGSFGVGAFTLPLAALSGEVVRLQLQASAEADITSLQVVTPGVHGSGAARKIDNVIVLLIDTLRADKLSPYNPDTRVKTPGLSKFLERAAVMRNARTQENWTKPSVATLLSSLLPWQHNAVTGEAKVPQSVELLPELLRKRGFYTGSFIANGYVSDKFGFKQGWHTYRNYIREGRRTRAQYVAADVLDWLDERPQDKPFFLYMHTIDPHVPYKPPQHFLSMYDAEPYDGIVNFKKTSTLLEKIKIGSIKLNGRDKVRLRALYDAEISYHDVHFAAVMEGLAKRGLSDNTMVVITSDHGEEFWDHGSVGHGHSVWDELLHVPMIVKIPGLTDGKQVVGDAVGLVDVMPTILEALGQPVPEELSGRSFLPQLRGEGRTAPRASVAGFMTGWRTLSVGRLKLIQRTLNHTWLYDTSTDPGETKDLAVDHPIATRYARGMLGLTLASADQATHRARKPRVHKREETVIDKETEAQLRALGYVGSSKR